MDEGGRKVFSDRPPPAHISPKQIIKQPYSAPAATEKIRYPSAENAVAAAPASLPAAAAVPMPAAVQPAAEPALSKEAAEQAAHDKALEEAQRKTEEAERKKQEAQQAKARKENCQRAQAAQTSLQSGALQARVNEKGERGIMTEEQRQAELQRTQKIIKDSCK